MSLPASLLDSSATPGRGLPPLALDAATNASPNAALNHSWRLELNARLHEHRQRRGGSANVTADAELQGYRRPIADNLPANTVAARVAERYRQAPSYQELLKASALAAESARRSAESAAEAAQEAHAAAEALLEGWEREADAMPAMQSHVREAAFAREASVFDDPFFTREQAGHGLESSPSEEEMFDGSSAQCAAFASQPASIEHHAPLPARLVLPARSPAGRRARALTDLVDAFAEALVPAAQALPAKLIEFPRELIAPRKQRPRLAEGPLLEEAAPGSALRIFEVSASAPAEADGILPLSAAWSAQGTYGSSGGYGTMAKRDEGEGEDEPRRRGSFHLAENEPGPVPSGWSSIRLGEHPHEPETAESEQPQARRREHGYRAESAPTFQDLAPVSHRLMGAFVDGGIVFACFLLSVLVFASCSLHPPAGKAALAGSLVLLGVLGAFYGWLFMSYGGGSTPGMRYARIALCTFRDENPTRKDLQNRIPATALALLPLGLGLFWALLDEQKLGWHDRMTRTYQRSYR